MLGTASAMEKKYVLGRCGAMIGLLEHLIKRVEGSNLHLTAAISEYDSEAMRDAGFYGVFAGGGRIAVSKAWREGVRLMDLPEAAEDILLSLSDGLGLLCREKQLDALKKALAELKEIYAEMEAEYSKKARYYGTLGALFGALAVIVLI